MPIPTIAQTIVKQKYDRLTLDRQTKHDNEVRAQFDDIIGEAARVFISQTYIAVTINRELVEDLIQLLKNAEFECELLRHWSATDYYKISWS